MPKIRLGTANRHQSNTAHGAESSDLDWIAEGSARAMSLNEPERLRRHRCVCERRAQQ